MDTRATLDAQTVRREIDALRNAFPDAFDGEDEGLTLPYRPGRAAHDDRMHHWCGER